MKVAPNILWIGCTFQSFAPNTSSDLSQWKRLAQWECEYIGTRPLVSESGEHIPPFLKRRELIPFSFIEIRRRVIGVPPNIFQPQMNVRLRGVVTHLVLPLGNIVDPLLFQRRRMIPGEGHVALLIVESNHTVEGGDDKEKVREYQLHVEECGVK